MGRCDFVVASQPCVIVGNEKAGFELFTGPAIGLRPECPNRADNHAYSNESEHDRKHVAGGRQSAGLVPRVILSFSVPHRSRSFTEKSASASDIEGSG
jgi:hypothetical protein